MWKLDKEKNLKNKKKKSQSVVIVSMPKNALLKKQPTLVK